MNVVVWGSEIEFDNIVPDLPPAVRQEVWEMWRDDLTTNMSKQELIAAANAILQYFGSTTQMTDVGWDQKNTCFFWEGVRTC